jgi:hypothetical protein
MKANKTSNIYTIVIVKKSQSKIAPGWGRGDASET